jgi:hypothetical protein
MSLPLGLWNFNANGFPGELHISAVDGQGNVRGTLQFRNSSVNTLDGVCVWDEGSQKITFMRVIDNAPPSEYQVYTGYLFSTDHRLPNGLKQFAGTFEGFGGSRTVYGWIANYLGL